MNKFYQSKQFLELQKKWYAKLERKGFEDIEYFNFKFGKNTVAAFIKGSSYNICKRYNRSTETYYRLARNFLEHATFSSKYLKTLWFLHCDGIPYRKLSKKMQQIHKKNMKMKMKFSTFWISVHIRRLASQCFQFNATHKEGIREYFTTEDVDSVV